MATAHTHQLTREEIAREEIGRTAVSRPLALVLAAFFLVVAFGWMPVQHWVAARAAARGGARQAPPLAHSLGRLPDQWRKTDGQPWLRRVFAANAEVLRGIHATDEWLDSSSWIMAATLPGVQTLLSRGLGVGNEKAYVGRDGWLYYRPDIDHLAGPGFLAPRQLQRRAAGGSEWHRPPQPDPVRGVLDFHRQLQARGIQLVVLPVPVKAAIHPEHFHPAAGNAGHPLRNPSFGDWARRLEQAGVVVVDVADALFAAARDERRPQYLATDTHWRPEAMERAAAIVAARIAALPDAPARRGECRRGSGTATNRGDLATMLSLPEALRPAPETVAIHPVYTERQELWRASPEAPVLVLGDSFCNVYSLPAMGWGGGAGFAEQLSCELGLPVDRLVRNDDGAWATRQMLARELAQGRDRLAGKRVVVWEFAARELTGGDWRDVPMDLGQPAARGFLALAPGQIVAATGTVVAVSPVPLPGSVPYRDHVVAAQVADLECVPRQTPENAEAVVYLRSMKNNELQPAAFLRGGQSVAVRLSAWQDVAAELDSINRGELDDWELQLHEPLWGELTDEDP